MMKIKLNITRSIVTALFLFLLSGVFAMSANAAPKLFFDPSPVTLPTGVDTEIRLQIDAESNSVFGADAVINFPSADITISSVTTGGYFSDFSYAPSSGKLEIHGYFGNSFDSKSGAGTIAIIKVKSNKSTGAGQMSFTCTGSGETEILRASDGQNILSCASLSTLTLSYGTASGGDNGSNNSGNNNSNGGTTSDPNATNACGGTCGSNYNCNSGLYCYGGYCRNPDCPTSLTCGACAATAKPTTKASGTPKSNIKATPEVVILQKSTPASASASPISDTEPTATPEATAKKFSFNGIDLKTIGIWGAIAILIFVILSAVASFIKNKNKPPQAPPTVTTTDIEPPFTQPIDTPTPPWQNPPQTPPAV